MSNKIEQAVRETVQPIVVSKGMELVDVEYRKRDGVPNVTVFIEKPGGVTLNDCEAVHNAIDAPLDELDPTSGAHYVLNVSSPGLDRAFKYDRDFERNVGGDLEIRFFETYAGQKMITAKLLSFSPETITVLYGGKEIELRRQKLAKVSRAIVF